MPAAVRDLIPLLEEEYCVYAVSFEGFDGTGKRQYGSARRQVGSAVWGTLGCGSTVFPSADGHDLKEIPPEQLYDQAAFVLQDNDLFDDTVRENIRIGRRACRGL